MYTCELQYYINFSLLILLMRKCVLLNFVRPILTNFTKHPYWIYVCNSFTQKVENGFRRNLKVIMLIHLNNKLFTSLTSKREPIPAILNINDWNTQY